MNKLLISISILLSAISLSASANDEVRFSQVGFVNGSDHALDVLVANQLYVVEPGETLSNPGMLIEQLVVLAPLGGTDNKMEFTRLQLKSSGCPQPICLIVN
ncbi:hypothetical protein ACN08N_28170 (plasmid) [Photobacterium leiognathi subsp. mandapamensis]|uniref:Uncharacterized protein n=1 Tax=Photobacterium toruni TaxID=1935446 RepID=A0A1T4UUM5_9GAMM|nr:hypothetical protein [Photobacterium toruni]SKA56364.1 hypothetical protein CZ814_03738 [Photobacterium toruni]